MKSPTLFSDKSLSTGRCNYKEINGAQSFIVPINAQYIHIKNAKISTLKYITIAPTCFGFD
jgi:hypothetical protein